MYQRRWYVSEIASAFQPHASCVVQTLHFLLRTRTPRKEESMKNVYVKWLQPLTNLPYEYILPQNLQKVVVHVLAN